MAVSLANAARILLILCEDPDLRMRDVAARIDITERAVQRIVHDLVDDGLIEVHKRGRRNHYEVALEAAQLQRLEEGTAVSELIQLRHDAH